jgi:hypothetical protein
MQRPPWRASARGEPGTQGGIAGPDQSGKGIVIASRHISDDEAFALLRDVPPFDMWWAPSFM